MNVSASRICWAAGVLAAVCGLAASLRGQAVHPRLMPEPVQIAYGAGYVAVSDLCDGDTQPLAAEEQFALRTLEQGLGMELASCAVHGGVAVRLERSGGVEALPVPGETPGPGSREAYAISVAAKGVEIQARTSAGVYYGVQTLLQMVEPRAGGGLELPLANVKDWPALSYRGTLVDAGSEGPMSTFAEVERQIDLIAKWKGNQYFFYSEGNIEMLGYPLLNPQARFTQQQIREIVAYARQRHIDVVPAVEMYGHLHDLFRIEKYSDLADFPHGGEFNPNDARVKAIVADWARQIGQLFPSRFVDVGFDETWSLSKAADKTGANSTPVNLFLQQLTTVTDLFQAQGKTVMAYADIMVKYPGIVPRLPRGLIALPWWYDPSPDPEYRHWMDPLVAAGVPHIVTTGVSSWDTIAPDYATSFANIDTFLAAGRKSHSLGLLNTLWTDSGQDLLQMTLPGVAYGAAAAWQAGPMDPRTFFAEYCRIRYGAAEGPDMAAALNSLEAAETALQEALGPFTQLTMWTNPFAPASLAAMKTKQGALRLSRLQAEDALEHLYAVRAVAPKTPQLDSLIVGAQVIDLAAMKFQAAQEIAATWATIPEHPTAEQLANVIGQGISNETHSRIVDMMDGFTEERANYEAAWLEQYTPYRMGTALGRWDAEYAFWLHTQERFEAVRMGFETGDPVPTLQQLTSWGN
jgi:hexosaminidase